MEELRWSGLEHPGYAERKLAAFGFATEDPSGGVGPHQSNQHDDECLLGRCRGRVAKGFRVYFRATVSASHV